MLRVSSAIMALGVFSTAHAAPVTLGELTFRELGSDITITSGSGVGSAADPFVLNETITGLDVTIEIRGLDDDTSFVGSFDSGFFLVKNVTNGTGATWNVFDLELQQTIGLASANGDGLSFAQNFAGARPFTSSAFDSVFEESSVRDQVSFFDGLVLPGQTVSFSFAITDNSPTSPIYLRQRPNFADPELPEPPAAIPVPPAAALMIAGLAMLGRLARRRG